MSHHPEVLDPRIAGELRRYHSWPHLHPQTVAGHSWNVARLILAWWPEAPRYLIIHALMHDIGERVAGDLPYPIKANNPVLKAEMDRIEEEGHRAMVEWGVPPPQDLAALPHKIFKLADLADMMEWAMHEITLGNRHARLVYQRTAAEVNKRCKDPEIPDLVRERIQNYLIKREQHEEAYHGD